MQTEQSDTLRELAQIRSEARGQIAEKVELPAGADPVTETSAAETLPAEGTEKLDQDPVSSPGEVIRIGDKEFKTQTEAIEYAKKLEQDKLLAESYNQGIREALAATQKPEEVPAGPTEEELAAKFYEKPIESLAEIKKQATQEALAAIQAEQRKENLWGKFLSQYPDIERKDAERILAENYGTLGKMTDVDSAMKILAQKTRDEYRRIADRFLPRKELPNKGGQVVSSGSGTPPSVTPTQKTAQTLDFGAQLRSLRRR